MSSIKGVKIAIVAGISDVLSTLDDTRWAKETLQHTLVYYQEHALGHLSYFTANNMSYFEQDVMHLF